MYYVDPNIKNTERIFPDQGRSDYLRLDMNENPLGLPEEVVARIRDCITPEFLSCYPEPDAFAEKYASFIGVAPEQLCITNGSDNAIRYVLQTFARKGKEVLTVNPTFEMYMVNCWLLGLIHKAVPYEDDLTIDCKKLAEAITDDTDMVVLVNPNNPMGNAYSEEDARLIIETANTHDAMVVVDEAYHYFTDKTLIKLIEEYDNLIVLRTFSKCLSLAGVRLGIAISNKEVAHYLNNLRMTFEVNTIALKCGEIVLDTPGLIDQLAATQIEGRNRLLQLLNEHGYETTPSEANFISFLPKTSADAVSAKLAERKILVKTFGSGALKGWVRINTGDVATMERFVHALVSIDH